MDIVPAIFACLVMASGWFYLFYSRAAQRLANLELDRLNRRRVGLRRAGGVNLFLLGGGILAGFYGVDQTRPTIAYLAVWLLVCLLLTAVVLLALLDMRLTWRLRYGRSDSL